MRDSLEKLKLAASVAKIVEEYVEYVRSLARSEQNADMRCDRTNGRRQVAVDKIVTLLRDCLAPYYSALEKREHLARHVRARTGERARAKDTRRP